MVKKPKRVPLWLQRLALAKAELRGTRFPCSAEEGIRQVAALSAIGLRMLEEAVESTMSRATEGQVKVAVRRLLARLSQSEVQRTNFWQRERARDLGT
jgi:hypothetical protein